MPLYNKDNPEPYNLSRARIENFCNCPKCFYREEKLGISKPSSFPFNLNNAVDELLKEELITIEIRVITILTLKKRA